MVQIGLEKNFSESIESILQYCYFESDWSRLEVNV